MSQQKPKNNKKVEKPVKKEEKEIKLEAENDTAGFSEHPLPTDAEIKDEQIEESLMEIYQDDNGELANVSTLEIKKRKGFIFYLASSVVGMSLVAAAAFGFIKYFPKNADSGSVKLEISAPKEVASGEEFFYEIAYKNLNNVAINNIEIRLDYPDNFVFLSAEPEAMEKNDFWRVDSLDAHRSGKITVKGKLLGQEDEVSALIGSMTYIPANFSSEFKKEAAFESIINNVGIDFVFEQEDSVFVNEESEIKIKYAKEEGVNLDNFKVSLKKSDNMELSSSTPEGAEVLDPGVWVFDELEKEGEFSLKFKIKEKIEDNEEAILVFEYKEGENYFVILEKKLSFRIIRNELNLSLIQNGSRNDQGIDFGKTLHYSIVYANKGDEDMEDVMIMAVLDGDILDWKTLEDANDGKVRGNTITWSREEIPALSLLHEGAEGTIDFSIEVMSLDDSRAAGTGNKYEVKSYAQFSIGNKEIKEADDAKSNVITSKVNSDLKLSEKIKYFDEDNIAVGYGPVPPEVGETTSFKVYWKLTNNLHELKNLKVETVLPPQVEWDERNRTTVGSIDYNAASRKVVWDIGRLPVDAYEIVAEFSIKITPEEKNKGKLMVLLSGTSVGAVDSVTDAEIKSTEGARTTKLEDDDIANMEGGLVQ